jgi:hypothetical protein
MMRKSALRKGEYQSIGASAPTICAEIRYNYTSSGDDSYRSKVVFVRAGRVDDGEYGCSDWFWFQEDYLSRSRRGTGMAARWN